MIGVAVVGASYHHPRLPKEGRHQLVDADPGRERVHWAGQVHECHRSRGARRTTLCRQEGEQRDAMPIKKSDRSAARPRTQWSLLRSAGSRAGAARSSAGGRRVPGRSRQDRARRPWRPRRGGASGEGERKGREERGRGAGQPAPREPRASTAAPPAAQGDPRGPGIQERETRGYRGTNRPIVGGEKGGGRGGG